jgi:peptidoglycan/LPS O-acetylase OafA/YrhL
LAEHKGSIKHLPGLDGLRGLAVLGVIVFHGGVWLKGGYLGVDLFFVLSGFLITSIILAEVEKTGKLALSRFWIRRARRLFPALLSLMPAIALYARFVAKPDELAEIRSGALATLGYVANWQQIFSHKSYWDLFAAPSPLEHTWSLAIEEQFYVVWPFLCAIALGAAKLRRKGFFVVTLVLFLASVGVSLALLHRPEGTSRIYFGTDTRSAAILMGAALACVMGPEPIVPERSVRALDVGGGFALLILGWAWVALDGQDPRLYRGGFWITELLCLVLIACGVAGKGSVIGRILAFRPLAYVGTISYGLYLWHWPIDCVLTPERVHVGPIPLFLLRTAATFAIAVPSHRFFESKIRANGLGVRFPVVVTLAAFVAAGALVFRATKPRPVASVPLLVPVKPGEYPGPFSVETRALPPASALRPGTLRILVLGDSVSQKLGLALRFRQEEFGTFVAERGVGNCSIMETLSVTRFDPGSHPDPSHGCAAHWVEDVNELQPDVTFIALGGGFFATMFVNGKEVTSCDPGWADAYRGRLLQLVDEMGPKAGRVMLMTVPYPMGRWRYEGIVERVDCYDRVLSDVAGARFLPQIDVREHVCPKAKGLECNLLSDGEPIRPDGLHPDGVGAEELARWTLGQIKSAAAR